MSHRSLSQQPVHPVGLGLKQKRTRSGKPVALVPHCSEEWTVNAARLVANGMLCCSVPRILAAVYVQYETDAGKTDGTATRWREGKTSLRVQYPKCTPDCSRVKTQLGYNRLLPAPGTRTNFTSSQTWTGPALIRDDKGNQALAPPWAMDSNDLRDTGRATRSALDQRKNIRHDAYDRGYCSIPGNPYKRRMDQSDSFSHPTCEGRD